MRWKSVAQKLGMAIAGALVVLVIAEAAFHVWVPSAIAYKQLRRTDPVLHHSLKPLSSYIHQTEEFKVEVRTNSMGFRDSEHPAKGKNERRILVFGDSFVEGEGVPAESCFTRRLENGLNVLRHDSTSFAVFNFGVSSYSPLLEYLLLKRTGITMSPDLVIVCFDMSDIQDDMMYAESAIFDSAGVPMSVQPSWLTYGWASWFPHGALPDYVREHSRVYALLNLLLARVKPLPSPEVGTWTGRVLHTLDSTSEKWQNLFLRSESYVQLMNELLSEHGAKLLLVVYPWGHQVSSSEWAEGRRIYSLQPRIYNSAIFQSLESFSRRNSISFLDMTAAFRRQSKGHLYYPFDGHWTTVGHRVAADTLLQFLRTHSMMEFGTRQTLAATADSEKE